MPKREKVTGRLTMSVGPISVKVNGKTVAASAPVEVRRELRGGRWVDVVKKGKTSR